MASEPRNQKEQDRPQQARQQLKRKPQTGKQPIPGTYDDELETEEGAPEAEPSRPK